MKIDDGGEAERLARHLYSAAEAAHDREAPTSWAELSSELRSKWMAVALTRVAVARSRRGP